MVLVASVGVFGLVSGAVGEAGEKQVSAKVYIQQLKTAADWQRRSQAAKALGEMGQEANIVVPALMGALRDRDAVVRFRATFALAKIGQPALPALLDALQHDRKEVRASASFALREIGSQAFPPLIEALSSEDEQIRASAAAVLAQMANDLQKQVEDLPTPELQQEVERLERTLSVLEPLLKTSYPKMLTNLGFQREDVETIRQARTTLRAEVQLRSFERTRQIVTWIVSWSMLIGIAILRFRPEILLRFSQRLVQARQKRATLARTLAEVQQFLQQAGAQTARSGKRGLKLVAVPGKLKTYVPLPVLLAIDRPVDLDVTELMKTAMQLARVQSPDGEARSTPQAGILLYQEAPDTLFRMRMAEVRLSSGFVLIPIPLAIVEQTLRDDTAAGVLAQYAERYLPGADLFDDRNAIGDTLSFFGRGKLLQRLEDELRRHQGIGLFGLRKSGKTSLLLQLGFAMGQHPLVHIDLQPYGGQRYYGATLFNRILEQLDRLLRERCSDTTFTLSRFDLDTPAPNLTAEFSQQISQLAAALAAAGYPRPILCFLDEIERILPMASDPEERAAEFNAFLGTLRSLSQEQQLLSLLVADVHPDCNRINQWPQENVPTNPVYNFFKEVFVVPFSEDETERMLTDIGDLMGVKFAAETLAAIHHQSGGHPFISRQLASLLQTKVNRQDNEAISLAAAERYLNRPYAYSGVLKDYFGQNIWGDLQKRDFVAAMMVFRLLACSERAGHTSADPEVADPEVVDLEVVDREVADFAITDVQLIERLSDDLTESQCLDALLWLEAVGLLDRDESGEVDRYRVRVPLLSRWLQMQMRQEEIRQWQLH